MPELDPPPPLFCFGSLMDTDVLRIVTGLDPFTLRIERAIARNHLQREVAEESFPILVTAPGNQAEGRLVHGLDARALDRVLFFEGEEYALAPLIVDIGGRKQDAQYFRDTGAFLRTGHAWDFKRWRRAGHAAFIDQTTRYMALYGTMSVAQADAAWLGLQSG